jgi:ectoine hydroxylase-related dioxygenase (phytanoyl-CoA dioxygenase family)
VTEWDRQRKQLPDDGFAITPDIFSAEELTAITSGVEMADASSPSFRKSSDLFAIRHVLNEIPPISRLIFSERFKQIVTAILGNEYFLIKSIYFDKPARSNWFVPWHQDLTISVTQKVDRPGYTNWLVKQNNYSVQPPVDLLQRMFSIRIHLDDTTVDNGALKVIPGSHRHGIQRFAQSLLDEKPSVTCEVPAGGIMLMRPLLMHASDRTTNDARRRVIHLEFSNYTLPDGLMWAER